jgi:hypothetical protein
VGARTPGPEQVSGSVRGVGDSTARLLKQHVTPVLEAVLTPADKGDHSIMHPQVVSIQKHCAKWQAAAKLYGEKWLPAIPVNEGHAWELREVCVRYT